VEKMKIKGIVFLCILLVVSPTLQGFPVISIARGQYMLGDRSVPGPLPPDPKASAPESDRQIDVVYGKAGDVELKLDFAKPKLCRDQKIPLAVYVHGGAWRAGDKKGGIDSAESRMFLQLGFAVASINYRLAPEYVFPAQINDCKLAIRFLRANAEKFGIDPDRIGIHGGSAGGHLVALMGLANDGDGLEGPGFEGVSSRVSCVVDYFGPSDLTFMTKEINDKKLPGVELIKDFLGCYPSDCPDKATQASPVTYADKNDPPTLIQHGNKDLTVPYSQSVVLAKKLYENNVPCALIKVKNGGHGFSGKNIRPSRDEITLKTVSHIARFLEPAVFADLDLNGDIDYADAIGMATCFGAEGTNAEGKEAPDFWNPLADLVPDGKIDMADWDAFWETWLGK